MNFAAPPPWAAEAPRERSIDLAGAAGAAVPFPGSVPWAPARKAPVNFLPAWQELQLNQQSQLQNQQLSQRHADPLLNLPPSHQKLSFPAQPQQSQQPPRQQQSHSGQRSARQQPSQGFGLAFPCEMTDEKEKRRRQQQEMQLALAEQIKEQRARKQMQKTELPAEEPGERWEPGRSGPKLGPKMLKKEPELDQRELERRRQQQELQRVLAAQVEETKRRKEEARQREKEEEDREEERLRREIEEENQRELRKAEQAKKASRARNIEPEVREPDPAAGRATRTRERFRDEPWRESGRLRKTRDRLRETRQGRSRRPRTREYRGDCEASPSRREAQSPAPSTAYAGPADTAGTWVGTCSPPPRRKGRDGELGFQGFVEQQRLLASEMQRQVVELRNQRDEAREQALKVKEDAINDRARHLQDHASVQISMLTALTCTATLAHTASDAVVLRADPPFHFHGCQLLTRLQELQQCLLEQLQGKPGSKTSQEIEPENSFREPKEDVFRARGEDLPETWEHSIASHSRFVAIDAGLAVLHGTRKQSELPQASKVSDAPSLVSPINDVSQDREACTVQRGQGHELRTPGHKQHSEEVDQPAAAQPHASPVPASERSSSTGGASPNFRLTDQLDKDKVAAFRKALDTANGLPADLRDDLCALLEESVEPVPPVATAPPHGNRTGRPPPGKAQGERGEGTPFPSGPQRPHVARARSSTPGTAELFSTPRRPSREERRAQSAAEASRREDSAWRRSEALSAAAASIVGS